MKNPDQACWKIRAMDPDRLQSGFSVLAQSETGSKQKKYYFLTFLKIDTGIKTKSTVPVRKNEKIDTGTGKYRNCMYCTVKENFFYNFFPLPLDP
jgi:hypothetical protein